MFNKTALKKLTTADLAFFKCHRMSASEKAQISGICLSPSVLEKLYPNLPTILEDKQNTIMLSLSIYGPGLTFEYNIERRIQKKGPYKQYLRQFGAT